MTESVLVTGAAGFIGRWVVAELLDRDHEVVGLDDLSGGSRRNIAAFEDDPRFVFHEGSVLSASTVDDLVESVGSVIHLAAEIDVQESLEDPASHFQTNVVGSQTVLEACRRSGTRLTLVGTCMVYDVANTAAGIDESHPVKPASPYAGSKLAAENLAESYYHGYDLPVTILRPFNTYGPYQKAGMAGGVVSIFLRRDIEGEPVQIFGDGTQSRDLMYVTDCARFVADAAFEPATVGEVVNAGTGTETSINDLAELIVDEEPRIEHVEHHHPQSEIQSLRCDPSKANDLLGWEPVVSLEEGVELVREWMVEGEL